MSVATIDRAGWGATAPLFVPMRLPSRGWWLHHTVTVLTSDPRADMRTVERIGVQRFGRLSYQWAYHLRSRTFLVGAGNTIGAHTAGQNSTSHGLALIGDFDHVDLPDYAVQDIGAFIAWRAERGDAAPVLLGGHRDAPGASTACPGRNAYRRLGDIRRAIEEGDVVTDADVDRIADRVVDKLMRYQGGNGQPMLDRNVWWLLRQLRNMPDRVWQRRMRDPATGERIFASTIHRRGGAAADALMSWLRGDADEGVKVEAAKAAVDEDLPPDDEED